VGLFYLAFFLFIKWNTYQLQNEVKLDKSIYAHHESEHRLIPLNSGPLSLAKRIEIIEQAEKSIEVEFFIYDLDFASKLLTKKLVEKAKQGVKVRLMVDFSLPVFKLSPLYAHFLKENGIQVKYYNTAGLHRIFAVQHRSHRKLLIVDDKYAITGGRNIANDYFNLSDRYNFLDADIFIEGEIVKDLRDSFDLYWNHELTANEKVKNEIKMEEVQEAFDFSKISKEDKTLFSDLRKYQLQLLSEQQEYKCNDITYVTDFPGVSETKRRVFSTLKKLMLSAKKEVIAESPYFVIRPDGLKLLEHMTKNGVQLDILTNGLYSTDAYYTVSALYPLLDELGETSLNLFAYNGDAPKLRDYLPLKGSKRWGIHSKRAIIDGHTLVIGTYNVDPRSANLNSEVIIICKNQEALALNSIENIKKRMKSSLPIIKKNKVYSDNLLKKSTSEQKMKFYLAMPLASLFSFLL
jgi:putative cardiolipin synthase